jgi:hypothetical protein
MRKRTTLKRKNRRILQIDVGNNGSADRQVPRARQTGINIVIQ